MAEGAASVVQGDGAPSSPFGGLPVLWFEGEPADEVYVVGADFRERFRWCVGLEAEVAYDLQDVLCPGSSFLLSFRRVRVECSGS